MRILQLSLILIATFAMTSCSAAPAAPAAQGQQLPPDIDVATADGLRGRSDVVMLDVRTPQEYAQGHIPGVVLIPLDQVANRLSEIPKDETVIVTCHSGNRSNQAAQLLRQKGYANVHNMLGGIAAWQQAGYPVEK